MHGVNAGYRGGEIDFLAVDATGSRGFKSRFAYR